MTEIELAHLVLLLLYVIFSPVIMMFLVKPSESGFWKGYWQVFKAWHGIILFVFFLFVTWESLWWAVDILMERAVT